MAKRNKETVETVEVTPDAADDATVGTPAPKGPTATAAKDLRADFKDGKVLRNGKDVAGTTYNTQITAEHAAPETAIKASEAAHFDETGMDPYEVYSMEPVAPTPPGP